MDDATDGERILAQTASLFAASGDLGTLDLLRAVQRVDFEQTDDGYVTESNWHDYYWAAVFYVEEIDRPAFTADVLTHVQPTLTEVCKQNSRSAVDRIVVRPVLPEPAADWRQALVPAATRATGVAENRVTEVTRRRIIDMLKLSGLSWYGALADAEFLQRIYDLGKLPSTDSRFETAEGDIYQHRFNNDDWPEDWIFTDSRFDLLRGSDDAFLRFLAEMVHPVVRPDTEEVEHLLEFFNEVLGRDGYSIAAVDRISGFPIYAGRRIPVASPASLTARDRSSNGDSFSSSSDTTGYEIVRGRGRGERRDYALDPARWKHGGQADIFLATHKTTRTRVVYKRRTSSLDDPIARMKREIEISQVLEGHAHFMPILDANANEGWIVMPIAEATAAERQNELRNPEHILGLVNSLIDVLSTAHQHDWLHRDITPYNVLLLDGRWMLADWGLVRRPRGQTTKPDRTRFSIGTEGFAAPELSTSPHNASPASDIYSIGRLVAWALTGERPRPNVPLYPGPEWGAWRTVVRQTTEQEPQNRPQTVQSLLALINSQLAGPSVSLESRVRTLLVGAKEGEGDAVRDVIGLAVEHPRHYDLHLQSLTALPPAPAVRHFISSPARAATVLGSLANLVNGDGSRRVQFGEANLTTLWLQQIAAEAAVLEAWDLLDESVRCMLIWDGAWDQWKAQNQITPWLRQLSGNAAQIAADALQAHPSSARHFGRLLQDDAVHRAIHHAIQEAIDRSRF
ncbi:protein kinase domain-containing protein [Streptomyces microflavus]|uniref:AbiJ-related protein n=1 Tax=Streptomyces microflavus TaxID=1919 RepID=UPI0033FB75FE